MVRFSLVVFELIGTHGRARFIYNSLDSLGSRQRGEKYVVLGNSQLL